MKPEQQAIFAEQIPFGPSNGNVLATLPAERQALLPTYPANLQRLFPANAEWLADNLYAVMVAWARWRASCRWAGSAC